MRNNMKTPHRLSRDFWFGGWGGWWEWKDHHMERPIREEILKKNLVLSVFTARVRSTTGRYCFHRCLSVHRGGGRGGTRVRYPPQGGTQVRVPPPGGGTKVRVPPPGGWYPGPGTPPGGVPRSGTPPGGGTRVGQQKEYSLHGGRYASCVHAGGLSC